MHNCLEKKKPKIHEGRIQLIAEIGLVQIFAEEIASKMSSIAHFKKNRQSKNGIETVKQALELCIICTYISMAVILISFPMGEALMYRLQYRKSLHRSLNSCSFPTINIRKEMSE